MTALTKKLSSQPIVKVIGNTQYLVESFFDEEAKRNLTDKIIHLMKNDVCSLHKTLQYEQSELTSHNP